MTVLAAWTQHTDKSRQLANAVRYVLDCRLVDDANQPRPRKAIADLMGITEGHLSAQLSGTEPLNLWRLAEVPGFMKALADVIEAEHGAVVWDAHTVQLLRAFTSVGKRTATRMLTVELPWPSRKEQAS